MYGLPARFDALPTSFLRRSRRTTARRPCRLVHPQAKKPSRRPRTTRFPQPGDPNAQPQCEPARQNHGCVKMCRTLMRLLRTVPNPPSERNLRPKRQPFHNRTPRFCTPTPLPTRSVVVCCTPSPTPAWDRERGENRLPTRVRPASWPCAALRSTSSQDRTCSHKIRHLWGSAIGGWRRYRIDRRRAPHPSVKGRTWASSPTNRFSGS